MARQLTSTPGFKSAAQWSPDGKELYYLEGGRINVVTVESRAVKPIAVSTVRLPTTTITRADGRAMEMHPRPVDVLVVRPMGESYTSRDSQLDAAVRELLASLPAGR